LRGYDAVQLASGRELNILQRLIEQAKIVEFGEIIGDRSLK